MESETLTKPFPELPVELVFLILETLLEIEPERALDLLCLSRDVRPIAQRAIYRCIILEKDWQAESFCEMFQSGQRSQSSYQNQVKVFCMTAGLKLHQILSIFSACSNLRMLGMFYWDDEHKSTAELDASLDALAASGPSPPKLACDLRWTLHHEGHPHAHRLALPLFQNVTHLELHSYDNFLHFDTKHLHVLPSLAYLSLIMLNGSTDPVMQLLQNLSLTDSILVCIFSPYFLYLDDLEPIRLLSKDPRIVFAVDDMRLDESEHRNKTILWRPLVEVDHFIRQWGRRLDGEEEMDMWEEAEAIVKVQRALQAAG